MQLYELDPLSDPRWDDFVATHPRATAFHLSGWVAALAKTYGYRPVAISSARPGEAPADGAIFCEVTSRITGNRLVSLPFSDHVEPLLTEKVRGSEIARWMEMECISRRWKYVEIRSALVEESFHEQLTQSDSFWLHSLDLTVSAEQLFRGLHKSCLQRRIRHAERQRLLCEKGSTGSLLDDFYKLLVMTRRRFRLLPQPRIWFQNLLGCMGKNAEILVARRDGKAIAAILILRHRRAVIYKYGCSDEALHHLGGMPFLFWRMIEESKSAGAEILDFGRSELDNAGLIAFKDRFGARRTKLNYFRYPQESCKNETFARNLEIGRRVFAVLPGAISSTLGRFAYRHIG
jgi:lipid II:glycine glycyltransferase (peptidoglycan interpeptide bridge formation enzyme)